MRGLVFLMVFALPLAVAAGDVSNLAWGGTPRRMPGTTPNVTLERESVRIAFRFGDALYFCEDVFRTTNGKPGKAELGYIDRGSGAEADWYADQAQAAEAQGKPTQPYNGLRIFRMYVDGREVQSKLVADGEGPNSLHIKAVPVPGKGVLVVKTQYRMRVGWVTAGVGGTLNQALFSLAAAAEWPTPMAKFELQADFAPDLMPELHPVAETSMDIQDAVGTQYWLNAPVGLLVYRNLPEPAVKNLVATFTVIDFAASGRDLPSLFFGYKGQ